MSTLDAAACAAIIRNARAPAHATGPRPVSTLDAAARTADIRNAGAARTLLGRGW